MKLKKGEKGFTLVELLVTVSIAALVVGAASATIITMMRFSPKINDWNIALRQTQNVGYWISRDVQMSQGDIAVGNKTPTFLTLTQPLTTSANATVVYQFEGISGGLGTLMRNYQIPGQQPRQTMIARYISTANTTAAYSPNCSANCTLTFTITATSGNVPVNRRYQAMQRLR